MTWIDHQQQLAIDLAQDQYTAAIIQCEQGIEREPTCRFWYWMLGIALLLQGNEAEADSVLLSLFMQADPEELDEWISEWIALLHQEALRRLQANQLQQAEYLYWQLLKQDPQNIPACRYLADMLVQQNRFEEAIPLYQQVLAQDMNQPEVHYNLGVVLQTQGYFQEAIAHYLQAVSLAPDNIPAWTNLGVLFQESNQPGKAIACYEEILQRNPEDAIAHLNRGIALRQLGEFKLGFAEFEWRWQHPDSHPRPFAQPVWDGSELQGQTILLHAEEGYGDTFQFIRYAPLVAQRGGKVVVECPPWLVRLVVTVAGIEQVVAIGTELPNFDVHASILSLPWIFGTTLESIPAQVPYLYPPNLNSIHLGSDRDRGLKVGLVWGGNPYHQRDHWRSCLLDDFLPLLAVPGVRFYSLQKGPRTPELADFSHRHLIQDLSDQFQDFADTAAAIAQLDLVISVDTSVAHLAGAMGHPTWTLLCYSPDWRWMLDREDSPWYPTMRLFRQNTPGDWPSVFERMAVALTKLATNAH